MAFPWFARFGRLRAGGFFTGIFQGQAFAHVRLSSTSPPPGGSCPSWRIYPRPLVRLALASQSEVFASQMHRMRVFVARGMTPSALSRSWLRTLTGVAREAACCWVVVPHEGASWAEIWGWKHEVRARLRPRRGQLTGEALAACFGVGPHDDGASWAITWAGRHEVRARLRRGRRRWRRRGLFALDPHDTGDQEERHR